MLAVLDKATAQLKKKKRNNDMFRSNLPACFKVLEGFYNSLMVPHMVTQMPTVKEWQGVPSVCTETHATALAPA